MTNVVITQQGPARNIGELALLQSEINFLNKTLDKPHITVFTLYPKGIKDKIPQVQVFYPLIDTKLFTRNVPVIFYPIVIYMKFHLVFASLMLSQLGIEPIYRRKAITSIKKADLIISGGTQAFAETSIFQKHQTISAKLTNLFILFWGALDVFLAKKVFKKRFITFPQSVGPFKTFLGRTLFKYIIANADAFALRETFSLRYLKPLNKKTRVYVGSDMAFSLDIRSKSRNQVHELTIGVSPCFPHSFTKAEQREYVQTLSTSLDNVIEKYKAKIVFIPSVIGQSETEKIEKAADDLEVSKRICQAMHNKKGVRIFELQTVEEYVETEKTLDLLITTRMHPFILAAISSIPAITIIYEHKQIGLLQKVGMTDYGIYVNNLNVNRLNSMIERMIHERVEITDSLIAKVDEIRKNNYIMVQKIIKNCLQQN